MESVYLETTCINCLVARPSGDVRVAAHRQITQDWWADRRSAFECYVSQVVIDEASLGDPQEVQKRMALLGDLPALEVTDDAESLTRAILSAGVIPPQAIRDAAHIAVAAVHEIDFLLTWNCRRLANAQIIRQISSVCASLDRHMPLICTPEQLMGE
jgi:hypothetical protein